jgi:hypothetical protein
VSARWQTAYVAMSAALGAPVDEAVGSLAAPIPVEAELLARELRSPARDVRVRSLARVLSEIALSVEAMVLS